MSIIPENCAAHKRTRVSTHQQQRLASINAETTAKLSLIDHNSTRLCIHATSELNDLLKPSIFAVEYNERITKTLEPSEHTMGLCLLEIDELASENSRIADLHGAPQKESPSTV
ncbi:hypothetical protein T265_03804 [Opisthorchis viverrini]|uniref:Uncharacterized protein n=1 Tax=Opisthorchis viverrini TaxID=6198 RepID=A0A075AHB7_OPIVI|nr:hypothetical protein T265_03804 [Opisthorchis viverrini]KER29604.1 hypothetical protein T265_03804 [Opisthorchis viverrini]